MKIYSRHVLPFGFKSGDIWSSPFNWHYYRTCKVTNTITVISNHTPQYVAQYQLTPKQMASFENGKVGITPPGCCNATGRKSIDTPQTIVQRDIKNLKDLKLILQALNVPIC